MNTDHEAYKWSDSRSETCDSRSETELEERQYVDYLNIMTTSFNNDNFHDYDSDSTR